MSAKHTPGPWIVAHDRKNPIVEAAALEDADGIWHNGGYIIGRFFGDDARENAALATAAPDLLAACADARDALLNETGNPLALMATLVTLDAAIAKATGNA